MRDTTLLRDPVPAAFAVRLAKAFGITFLALPSLHAYVLLLGVGPLRLGGGR